MKKTLSKPAQLTSLPKSPTGIAGLDQITSGGLPAGRPTLICGNAGCGKTLLATEFLVRGATRYDEPGVFIAFEETEEDVAQNAASLGFNLKELIRKKKLFVDYVHIDKSEFIETGEFDLEGLFIRIDHAIKTIGAKRLVLDTIETLFSGFSNQAILRSEIRRLFYWLKSRGITTVITGERGENTLTRHGLEEYVSDCVILLDHRVNEQISTRRLRVIKYRGSSHGTNEYPFLIDDQGFAVLPVTSLGLDHKVSNERVSTGIARLDSMLGGKGYYAGSSVLVTGTAGTGKTSLAAYFADATCRAGKRCLFFAFEESESQLVRNMKSIGVDLDQWVRKGLLRFQAVRPTLQGLEYHLVSMHKLVDQWKPRSVVVDPITNLINVGNSTEVQVMLTRLVDLFKTSQITALYTSLTLGSGNAMDLSDAGVSSLADTWILVRDLESNGERNRGLFVLKSRGMAHSNQIREFNISDQGVELIDVFTDNSGFLVGSARIAHEEQLKVLAEEHHQELKRKERELQRKKEILAVQINSLKAGLEAEESEFRKLKDQQTSAEKSSESARRTIGRNRKADLSIITLNKRNGDTA